MVWERLTDKWYECPFLGNGMLGIQIRQADKNTVRFDVGRGDVQSHGEGAFLVSAVRRKGQTRFIRIKSLAGAPCVIKSDLPEPICISGAKSVKHEHEPDGRIRLNLKKGQEVILYSAEMPINLAIQPVPGAKELSKFGLKKE